MNKDARGWGTVLRASLGAFALNLLLQLALHVLPPISFFVPVFTGFITGWRLRATKPQSLVLGVAMGVWLAVLCTVVGGGLFLVAPNMSLGAVAVVTAVLVLHLAAFAAAGAMIGGHYARKDESERPPDELRATGALADGR